MLLYALIDQPYVTGFIEFLDFAEPDQVVGGVLVGVLHSVIQTPYRQAQWADWLLFIMIWSRSSLGSSGNLLGLGKYWPPGKWHTTPPSLLVVRLFGPQWDCISYACLICRHPSYSDFFRWPHQCFSEVGHLYIWFWALYAQISDGRHLWVGEGGHSFSHDGWMTAVTVCLSKVSLQFLHSSIKFVGCYWSKVKSISFPVSAPALEVSLCSGLWAWFISSFLNSVLIGIGGLYPFPISQDIQFITLRWAEWFWLDHYPTYPRYFLFLCWIHVLCLP